ncbi:MAG: PEP-utilizing enzyme [Myxococcota bacterium]
MQLNFVLQDGRHLRDVTYAHPVLLLFLRQLGCTFCREAVRDLSQLRDAFDARGVEVVLVHQGTLEQGDEVLAQFGGGHFARVADPARKLYAEFNLKLASTGRAFGIPMWLRAFEVVRSGVSLGKLVGDGWQMPGCFVLHQGRILSSFPYDMVSDRPDYLAFVDAALTQDVQQLGQLMPDGRIQSLSLPPALQRWQKRVLEGRARLLLVGGNGSLPARFEPTLPHLREHMAARVVEVAGQGGRKAAALPDTLEGFAQDLARELDREARTLHRAGAEGPLVLYGHGIGGLILAHACRWMEEKPERLILHAPVGVHLAQRRFPSLMKLPGMRPLARMLLGVESLATLTARRLMQEHSEATVMDMQNFARGYREAASFSRLFDVVEPLTALEGLEHLTVPTVLLWGGRDPVLDASHLAAWAEQLKRAPVLACLEPQWGHYPYLDQPGAFAARLRACLEPPQPREPLWMDARVGEQALVFHPRTKGGRLLLMRRAGLASPSGVLIPAELDMQTLRALPPRLIEAGPWAVRSSALLEDTPDTTGAGRFLTRLDVPTERLLEAIADVRASGLNGSCDVVVMPMVPRRVGGVAWVRPLGVELEVAEGGAEAVVEGRAGVLRMQLSWLGAPWHRLPERLPGHLSPRQVEEQLWPALESLRRFFGVSALDVEWCYHPDGGFTLLQARPLVAGLSPRRLLSAANIKEIVPPVPSPLLVDVAEGAAWRLPRYYARLDEGLVGLEEPFTCTENGRYYLNLDLLAAIFDRWGLPRAWVSRQVGGQLPPGRWRPLRFVLSVPVFWRLLRDQSRLAEESQRILEALRSTLPPVGDAGALVRWFERAYEGVVTGNLRISGVMAGVLPVFREGPDLVTQVYAEDLKRLGSSDPAFLEQWGHRCAYESDPAWPRADHPARGLEPRAFLPDPLKQLPAWRMRLPWLHPRHVAAHREWFRDSSMRVWAAFRARLLETADVAVERGELSDADAIFSLGKRELEGEPALWSRALGLARRAPAEMPPDLFWSDSLEAYETLPQEQVVIRAGEVEGVALVARTPQQALGQLRRLKGPVVLVAPAVGPGWEPVFQKVVGVITELGGRLSHAGLLLREDAQYNMPVVFNVRGATGGIKTGEAVKLEVPPGRLVKQ